MNVRDPRSDGSYNAMQLDALSWAQTSADVGIAFDGTTPLSVDAWIRFDGLPAAASALSKEGVFAFGSAGPSLVFSFDGLGTVVSDPNEGSLRDDSWHYLCVTYDGGTVRLYLDGEFNTAQGVTGKGRSSPSPILIGSGLQGLVRRVRVYNTPLTAESVRANMSGEPAAGTLVADFDFSVALPVDRGSRANPITLCRSAQMVSVSPALSLGPTGFARPFDDCAVNPGGVQIDPYSVQAWIYVTSADSPQQAIFVNSDLESDTGMVLLLQHDPSAGAFRVVSQRGSAGDSSQTLISRGLVQVGTWTNVATTFDGARLALYLDGKLDSSRDCAPIPSYRPESNLLIGATLVEGVPVGAATLQGFIRTVDVFGRALSATEILSNVTALPDPNDATLVAAYDFTSSPARNLVNGHPIGLAEGAVLAAQLGPAARSTSHPPRTEAPAPDPGLDAETLAGFRASLDLPSQVQALGGLLRNAMEADVAAFADPKAQATVRRAWEDALRLMTHEPEKVPLWLSQHRHGGEDLLVCHTARGSYVAFRAPENTISDCTMWKIQLVVIVVAGVIQAFTGLGSRSLTVGAVKYIGKVLANPEVLVLLAAGTAMTGGTIFRILGVLCRAGYLRTLIELLVDVGFWTLLWAIARLVLIALGVGSAAVIAALAVTVIAFIDTYRRRPASCDPLPTVDLASITFHHHLAGQAGALAIRQNFAQPIQAPEWVPGHVAAASSPAAYALTQVTGQIVAVVATFAISGPTQQVVGIRALGGGILGQIDPTVVLFGPAGTATVVLQLPHHTLLAGGVQVQNITWTWEYQIGGGPWTRITATNHRIYVVLDVPHLPWVQGANHLNTQLPWTEVLDRSCVWAAGAATAQAALELITTQVNSQLLLTYDVAAGASVYTDGLNPENFLCTQFLAYLATGAGRGNTVNCTDCATIVTTFANIAGCNASAAYMADPLYPAGQMFTCNEILAIGSANWQVPFHGRGDGFSYHEVAWTDACGFRDPLYDACLCVDTGPDPWEDPDNDRVAGLPLHWPFTTQPVELPARIPVPFEDLSYRERLATQGNSGIGRVVPRGAFPEASAGRRPVL